MIAGSVTGATVTYLEHPVSLSLRADWPSPAMVERSIIGAGEPRVIPEVATGRVSRAADSSTVCPQRLP